MQILNTPTQAYRVRLESGTVRQHEGQDTGDEHMVWARSPTAAVLEAMEASPKLEPSAFPHTIRYQVRAVDANATAYGPDLSHKVNAHAVRQLSLLRCKRFGKQKQFHVFGVCQASRQRFEWTITARGATEALLNAAEQMQRASGACFSGTFTFCGVVQSLEESPASDIVKTQQKLSYSFKKSRRDKRSLHTVFTPSGSHSVYAFDRDEAEQKCQAQAIAGVLAFAAYNELESASLELIQWALHRNEQRSGVQ